MLSVARSPQIWDAGPLPPLHLEIILLNKKRGELSSEKLV